jgi:iron complex transport system substrate-binding protein
MIYTFFGWTAGNGTFIGALVERAGASNVAAEAGIEGYEELNEEVLVDQDPDWILLNSDDDQVPKTAAYNGTTAVQKDQILVVNYNQLNRPAPRVIYPLVAMTKAMHPEAYAQANQTESDTATGTETASPTATTAPPTGSPDTETEDGSGTGASGPGFTAIGALVALVCLSLVAARREA